YPAARVEPARTGECVVPDCGSVRRRFAVEKLGDRGARRVDCVAGETPHGETGRMRQQSARRHLLMLGVFALGQMPGLEQRVDARVERDLALLGDAQESAGKYWFANRAGEEERRAVDWFAATELGDAV